MSMLSVLCGLAERDFDILYKSEGSELQECHTFLLAEDHFDEEVRKVNSIFISQVASSESVLLLEGVDTMTSPLSDTKYRESFFIDKDLSISLLGWDMPNYSKKVEAPQIAWRIASLVDMRDRPIDFICNWEKEMLELFDHNLQNMGLTEEFSELVLESRRQISLIAHRIDEFDKQRLHPYIRRLSVLKEEMSLIASELSTDSNLDIKKLRDLINEAKDRKDFIKIDIILAYNKKLFESSGLSIQLNTIIESRKEFISSLHNPEMNMAERNFYMIQTLENASKLGKDKLFLIAGLHHLDDKTDEAVKEYLRLSKGVVVLKPKLLK